MATIRGDGIRRYRVDEDGTTSEIADDPLPPPASWVAPMVLAGVLGCGFCVLVMVGLGTGLLPGRFSWLFLVGLAAACGLVFVIYRHRPQRLLNLDPTTAGVWNEPTRLGGWQPRTVAQLDAVERLVDEHGGFGRVRETARDAADVLVRHWGRRLLYQVDASGGTSRIELSSRDNGAPWLEVRTRAADPD